MNKTGIAWTQETWNVWSGCDKVSPGCKFCYAETLAERRRGTPAFPNGFDLTIREHKITEPLKLKQPTLIFVNSMSDFFLESVSDDLRDRVVDVMEQTPRHEYQVLTKRPREMLRYSKRRKLPPNFWAGVSVDTQHFVTRLDVLREVDVDIRFLSAEPILSHLDLNLDGIHWCIAGGESGSHLFKTEMRSKRSLVDYDSKTKKWTPRADRYHWITDIRDQCIQAGVAFFFKQWGGPTSKSTKNLLDGRTWEEFPQLLEQNWLIINGEIMTKPKKTEIVDADLLNSDDTAIDITPMTAQEARECADAIKGNLESLRLLLLQLQRREGWKALGYSSWRECAQKEFGQSQGYVYKLLHAAEVEENLAAAGFIRSDKSESLPITQLEELHKLPPDQQAAGLQKANELAIAEGKPRTAAHVSQAVRSITKPTSVVQEIAAQGKALRLRSNAVGSSLSSRASGFSERLSSVLSWRSKALVSRLKPISTLPTEAILKILEH